MPRQVPGRQGPPRDLPDRGEPPWVYGIQPVLEALKDPDRRIEKIWIAHGRSGAAAEMVRTLARNAGITVSLRDRSTLDRKAGTGKHQGVVALLAQVSGPELESFLSPRPGGAPRFFALLDGVEDPRNLGAIVRSACAAGVEGLILPRHSVCPVTPTVIKASAGGALLVPLVRAGNASRALERVRRAGITVLGADPAAATGLYAADLRRDICLVLGGEGTGIRPVLKELCDELISIPMAGRIGSLNVSVAAGILFFEVQRQRLRERVAPASATSVGDRTL